MLLDLDLHQYKDELKVRKDSEGLSLWDPVRKRHVRLQPEELVRQLLILYLTHSLDYPINYFQIERGLAVNNLARRFDILVMDRQVKPFLLIECKSHKINLNQSSFDQISNYNMEVNAPYILVSNGVQSYCAKINRNSSTYAFVDIPPFPI